MEWIVSPFGRGTAISVLGKWVVAVACLAAPLSAQTPRRANLIFILADDLGYGEIGPFGQKVIRTPVMDRMAREGMRLSRFYTGTPVCAPSRANLMTGMHNGHSRVRDNDVDYLRPQDITLAEVLKFAGYRTGLFGKWGLSFNDKPESFPTRQGFDRFFGYLDQRHAHNFYPTFLIDDEDTLRLKNVVPNEGKWGQGNASEEVEYSHDLITDRALQFIEANKDTSFFMYVAFTIPHINNEGAGGGDGGFEVPDLGPYQDEPWSLPKKSYASMITRMDRDIGRLLDRIKALGLDGNTCVVFTSDNGPTYLRNGQDTVGAWFDGNGPFRGYKSDMYEGGIHMPALVRWPGMVPAGSTSPIMGFFPDIMPTLAEIAGVSVPSNIDGISLAPSLLGRAGQKPRDYLYWYYPFKAQRAVRMGPWKAVWREGTKALYNLDLDTAETTDLQGQHADIMRQMDSIDVKEGTAQPVVGNWVPALKQPVAVNSFRRSSAAEGREFAFEIAGGNLRLFGRARTWDLLQLIDTQGRVAWQGRNSGGTGGHSLTGIKPGVYSLVVSAPGARHHSAIFAFLD